MDMDTKQTVASKIGEPKRQVLKYNNLAKQSLTSWNQHRNRQEGRTARTVIDELLEVQCGQLY